jgi:exodeoxyribonuclease-5
MSIPKLDLRSSVPFLPTIDQEKALGLLETFFASSNYREIFLLRGFAGTGKTSLLAHIAQTYAKHKKNVVLLAPTGRAARILSEYCQMPAYTIHKRIYRLAEEMGGEMNFVLQRNVFEDTLFIVDEASMIASNNPLERDVLTDLLRYVYRGKGCRLIISGDNAQLPPVGMETSPALDAHFLRETFHLPVTDVQLSEVVRQASESGILENATRLRQLLQASHSCVQFIPNGHDVKSITGLELQESLEECIHRYGMDEVLFITRSNKRANQFNSEIRNRLLFREEEIQAGDFLMAVKNNYHWLKSEENKEDFIANGEVMEILRIEKKETLYGQNFADVSIRFVNNRIPDVGIKIWLNSLITDSASMSNEDMRDLYYSVYNDYLALGETRKAKSLTMNDPYFNAVQVKFAYAVTCHKAQGGQWSAVFIDHGFLTEEMVDVNLIRWFYTALTRAKQEVYLVNFHEMFL